MDAVTRSRPTRRRARRLVTLLPLVVVAIVATACSASVAPGASLSAAPDGRSPATTAAGSASAAGSSAGATAPTSTTPASSGPDAGGSARPDASGETFPLTLTDDDGTSVRIPATPSRIVSLTPATTEILFEIGAGDRVIAKVDDPADYPPEAHDLPIVGTFDKVDVEKIVGLEADLVIAGGNGGTPADAIERLRSLGVPVVVVYASDVEGVFHDIELTGQAAGSVGAARDLSASMRAGFDQVAAATRDAPRPRVFYETGDTPALYGVADDSFPASMIELAGGEPVTTGSTTVWEMPVERLVAADPEIIVLGDAAYGVTPEAAARRAGWTGLSAVRAGAIRPIDDIVVTRPGPRLLDGLRHLVAAIHPDLELSSAPPDVSPAASVGGY